jgi:hypothetical protein
MKRLTKILITGTALMILPLNPAFADGSTSGTGSNVLNGQIDFQVTSSNLNTNISTVNGSVANTSSAVGNNLEVVTMDNTVVTNNQYVSGVSISADQTASVNAVAGTVNLQSQAICNAADVSTDPHVAAVNSNQVCNSNDPSSLLNASVSNVGSDVTLGATSIGNNFSEDTNAATMPVQNIQTNNANIAATVNSTVYNVNGNVSVNSSAIGNNAQIVHY